MTRATLGRFWNSGEIGATLVRRAGSSMVITAIGTLLVLILQVILARLMGAAQFGIFVYVNTFLNLLVLPAMLGWNVALLRFLPIYSATEQWGLFRGVARRSFHITLAGCCIVGAAMSLVIWLLHNRVSPDLQLAFWIGCISLPAMGLQRLSHTMLRASRMVVQADLPMLVFRPLFVALFAVVAWASLARPPSAATVTALQLLAVLVSYGISELWLRAKIPPPARGAAPEYRTREWMVTALPMLWVSSAQLFFDRTNVILLGMFTDVETAGIFSVASNLPRLISYGLQGVLASAPPLIAELHSQGRRRELQRALNVTALIIISFAVPIFIVIILGGSWFLEMFGHEFTRSYPALCVMAIGVLVDALAGPVNAVLMMTGHERDSAYFMTGAAVLNVTLNVLFIPRWGMVGAASASAISLTVWNLCLVVVVKHRLGLRTTFFGARAENQK